MAEEVAYEPMSVKRLLAEMKNIAELMIDLSYSAVLLGDDGVAEEVLALEAEMDVLQLRGRMSLLMAARNPRDAERLAPVLGMIGAAEKISDATGDIAKVVLEDIGLPPAMSATLPEALEAIARSRVAPESAFAGERLGDLDLETETGVRAIALHHDDEWVLNPDAQTRLDAGAIVLFRGSEDAVAGVHERVTTKPYRVPDLPEPDIKDLERAVDSVILMKNMSELAVDLAYGAVLYDSQAVASEVVELEAEVDALQSRFEAWTLRAATRVEDPVSLRGLVHLARSTEVISDAAVEISEGVLRGLSSHPVIAEAVEESDEVIVRVTVEPESPLNGATLGECMVRTETGMRVIGVRRTTAARSPEADDTRESATETPPNQDTDGEPNEWVISPGPDTVIRAGNVLLAKGTRAAAEGLDALVGSHSARE